MTQLSTTGTTDVSQLIGALEIGNLPAFDDGALEAAGGMLWAAPTRPGQAGCPMPATLLPPCHPFNDGALEASGVLAGPSQHTLGHGCPLPPTVLCRHIDDGALEAAAKKAGAADPVGTRRLPTMPGRCF